MPYHSHCYAHSLGTWTPWEYNLQFAASLPVEHWQAWPPVAVFAETAKMDRDLLNLSPSGDAAVQ